MAKADTLSSPASPTSPSRRRSVDHTKTTTPTTKSTNGKMVSMNLSSGQTSRCNQAQHAQRHWLFGPDNDTVPGTR